MFDKDKRVLVVDDMVSVRKLISKILNDLGLTEIVEAGDGTEGWQTLQNMMPPPSLIISDMVMPNGSGLDFLKRLRATERFSTTPFLLLSGELEESVALEAVKAGVDAFIVKPFTLETMREKIQAAFEKRGKA